MTKTIFEKAYLIKAQAEKAAAKAVEAGELEQGRFALAQDGKKWKIVATAEPATNLSFAEALAESGETLDELKDADRIANASMGLDPAKPKFSTAIRPTKLVWNIADSMPKASRKEVMEECVRQGIAYGTARTQYQAWFKASQEAKRDDIRKPYEKAEK